MHKIYCEKRCISIVGESADMSGKPGDEYPFRRTVTRNELSDWLRDDNSGDIHILTETPEETYKEVCSFFSEVNAAGGLVRNSEDDCLMLLRSGKWDLPKGHQENGEDIRQTALREVEEETGVCGIKSGDLICITDHCYFRDGKWTLKHTWWYGMSVKEATVLKPQTEEGISNVEWIAKERLGECLDNTYPSIREVFEKEFVSK